MKTTFPIRNFVACALVLTTVNGTHAFAHTNVEDAPVKAQKQTYTGPKKRIAVMNAVIEKPSSDTPQGRGIGGVLQELNRVSKQQQGVNTLSDVGNRMCEMLTTSLSNTGHFILLDRANLDDIRGEIKTSEELGNEKTAVKKGGVLGAQVFIRVAVTEFTDNKNSKGGGVSLGGIRVGGGKKLASVTVDIKMVDAVSSRVLSTASASGDSESKAAGFGISLGKLGIGGNESSNEPIEKATRNAIEKAVDLIIQKMEKVAWEGQVITASKDTSGARLVLNRGQEDGIEVGQALTIYKQGEELKDPSTGESLGRDEDEVIGEAKVTSVQNRTCVLRTTLKASFAAGNIAKWKN